VLGVDHQEIEAGESEQLRDAGGRPAEKAAEERLARPDSLPEVAISCQLSALSFLRRDAIILLTSITLFSRES